MNETELAETLARNPSLKIARNRPAKKSLPVQPVKEKSFTVFGPPAVKPRQTQSDRWNRRPCVVRYREWADRARECAGALPLQPSALAITVYIQIPKSWNAYKREHTKGKPHKYAGDADNYLKACADALYPKGDEMIYRMSVSKFWDDGHGPRVEIAVS